MGKNLLRNIESFQVFFNAGKIVVLLFHIGVLGAIVLKLNELEILQMRKIERERIYLILGILFIGFIVFKDYFLLENVYIYNDVGSDTYFSYWPYLTYLSNMIYTGTFSFWSFNIGIGTSLFSTSTFLTDPFNIFTALWGPRLIVYVLPYIALMKIMIAALGFYTYLKYIGINKYSSLIASLLYGFNGFIILWGQHYHFGTIIVFIPFVLLGFEKWMKEKKISLYIISLFLIAFSGFYFLYIFAVFFIMYVLVRYFETYRFQLKHFVMYLTKVALYSIAAISLSSIILLPSLYVALNNPRVSGQLIGNGIFNFAGAIDYISIILRLFSNDILGTGNQFYGLRNYYEAPVLYTGTVSLLLVPIFFVYANKKNRIIYGILFLSLFLFLLFPFFSLFFNAFSVMSYRWTFVIIIFISILNAKSLNYITEKKVGTNSIVLFLIFISIAFISVVSLMIGNEVLNWSSVFTHSFKHLFISLSLLVIYSIFIKKMNGGIYKTAIFVLICIELTIFSSITVNRVMLNKESVQAKIGYNDYTNEAIAYINKMDEDSFRVDKSYNSVFLADAMSQGYYGVKSYNSLNQPSYVKFLREMKVPFKIADHPNYITGLDFNTTLSRLLGVKYLLINDGANPPNGYDLINEIQNIKIYQDEFSLPLGFTYNNFISYGEFMKLNAEERSRILLKAFVSKENMTESSRYKELNTSKGDNSNVISTIPINEKDVKLINIEPVRGDIKTSLTFNSLNNDPQILLPIKPIENKNQKIKVSMNINSSIASEGQIFFGIENGFSEENSVIFSYGEGKTFYERTFDYSDLRQLRMDISNSQGQFTISNLKIQVVDNESLNDIEKLKKNTLKISEFSNDYIKGSINANGNQMLYMSIPYDKGWKAKVDGESVLIEKINIGFIGISIEKGTHEIELKYEPPFLKLGFYISLISLILLVFYYFYFRNKKRQLV